MNFDEFLNLLEHSLQIDESQFTKEHIERVFVSAQELVGCEDGVHAKISFEEFRICLTLLSQYKKGGDTPTESLQGFIKALFCRDEDPRGEIKEKANS
jgi:hypothetical protein